MQCTPCQAPAKKFGKDRKGNQRYRCLTCRKTFSTRPERLLGEMRLPVEQALLCLHMLCEGNAVRAVERALIPQRRALVPQASTRAHAGGTRALSFCRRILLQGHSAGPCTK